jgi:hypothetical protein
MTDPLENARILVTGPTGQVALPVTLALAERNDVIGIARFRDAEARAQLEATGVSCVEADLATGDFRRAGRRRLRREPCRGETAAGISTCGERRSRGLLVAPAGAEAGCSARRPASTSRRAGTRCARPTRSATTTA